MAEVVSGERATRGVLVKFTPSELADLDAARGGVARTVFIKRYMAAVVRQIEKARLQEVADGDAR